MFLNTLGFSRFKWKGGQVAISEYKCSRLALIAAIDQKGAFSGKKSPLQRRHLFITGKKLLMRSRIYIPLGMCSTGSIAIS
jgi:hypothetical protein